MSVNGLKAISRPSLTKNVGKAKIADRMYVAIDNYNYFKNMHKEDIDLKQKIAYLKQWQVSRLKKTHDQLLLEDKYRSATEFVIGDIYCGMNLSAINREIERAIPLAIKMFSTKIMHTAACALELNALTEELDAQLAVKLFKEMRISEISVDNYLEAYRNCGDTHKRFMQIELAQELAGHIEKYIDNLFIYSSFKVIGSSAKIAGFVSLHDFIERGFRVLRPLGDTRSFLYKITELEHTIIKNIQQGIKDPFIFSKTS